MSKTPDVVNAFALAVQAGVAPYAEGEPGTAKSALHEAIARQLGFHLEPVVASLLFDSSDVNGINYVTPDGGLGHVMAPFVQSCMDASAEGLVPWMFFDELPTAAQAVRAGLLRVVVQKDVNGMALPEEIRFSAAGNPLEQGEGGSRLSAAMANRFCHLDWSLPAEWRVSQMMAGYPDPPVTLVPEGWEEWLEEARLLSGQFILSPAGSDHFQKCPRERKLQSGAWPSGRSWENANRCVAACASTGLLGSIVESLLLEGCVGSAAAQQFLSWRRELALPDPEDVLRKPRGWAADRGDRVLVTLFGVVRAVATSKTQDRYDAAFQACLFAEQQGFLDVAAMAAGKLCALRSQKGGNVLVAKPKMLTPFVPFLRQAGFIG